MNIVVALALSPILVLYALAGIAWYGLQPVRHENEAMRRADDAIRAGRRP